MQKLFVIVLLLVAAMASADYQIFEVVEHAAEVRKLELSNSGQQLIYARRCDDCPVLALSLGPRAQIYDGRSLVGLSRAAGFDDRGGTIFFDPATRLITRIVFWNTTRPKS